MNSVNHTFVFAPTPLPSFYTWILLVRRASLSLSDNPLASLHDLSPGFSEGCVLLMESMMQ